MKTREQIEERIKEFYSELKMMNETNLDSCGAFYDCEIRDMTRLINEFEWVLEDANTKNNNNTIR